jgi:F-type H+-transporting ATPase subunit b
MILYDSTLITPTTGLMIWTLVTFVIVLIVLRRYAYGPLQQMIDERRKAITADLDAAESARGEAQAALAEYRQQLAEARKEATKIIEDARRVGDERRAAAVADLEAEKARLMRQTQEEIQAETRQALNSIKRQVADLAVAATEKVVRARLDEAEQRRLIDEALADVDLTALVPPAPEGEKTPETER